MNVLAVIVAGLAILVASVATLVNLQEGDWGRTSFCIFLVIMNLVLLTINLRIVIRHTRETRR